MPPMKGVELEVTEGITEHSSRVALKGVFQNFGDVVACWVPPIDRRHRDRASIRFGNAASAEAAKNACDAGQVFLQGLALKVDFRLGGGRRVGNSDLAAPGAASMPQLAGLPGMSGMDTPAMAVFDPVAEARRKVELDKARAERAKQLKRGPGVAALVQGALKRALTTPTVKRAEEEERPTAKAQEVEESDEDDEAELEQRRIDQLLEETKKKEMEERQARERERAERESRERREQAMREAAEAERALLQREAETREQRIKSSVDLAKRQQAARTGNAGSQAEALYGHMPEVGVEPNPMQAANEAAIQREKDNKNLPFPPEDRSKVLFLDVDGVLRPARAGGFDTTTDGDAAKSVDTSDFFPSAVKALRHILDRTTAKIVLSSEWRRSESLCSALSDKFTKDRVRPWSSTTPSDLELEKSADPVRSFAVRRSREISAWLQEHERVVSGWVVLDDINLGIADETRKGSTKMMQPHLVQTWPLCGLTMGNAKTAVRILNGEMINKVVVERPVAPVGTGGSVNKK